LKSGGTQNRIRGKTKTTTTREKKGNQGKIRNYGLRKKRVQGKPQKWPAERNRLDLGLGLGRGGKGQGMFGLVGGNNKKRAPFPTARLKKKKVPGTQTCAE